MPFILLLLQNHVTHFTFTFLLLSFLYEVVLVTAVIKPSSCMTEDTFFFSFGKRPYSWVLK